MNKLPVSNRNRLIWACAVVAWALTGCGDNPHGGHVTGTVEITVLSGNEMVTEGEVVLSSSETGLGGGGALGPNGKVRISSVPVGEYTVTVAPPMPDMTDPNPTVKEYPKLPEQFRDETTSGLKVTVKQGINSFSFDLQDE